MAPAVDQQHSDVTCAEGIYSKVCNQNVDSTLQIIDLCKNIGKKKHDKHGLIKKIIKKKKVEIGHPS